MPREDDPNQKVQFSLNNGHSTQANKLLQVVYRHGERTPVRKRLTQIFPDVWSLYDANKAMFATAAEFNEGQMTGVNHVPLQELVDTETKPEKSIALNPGAWSLSELPPSFILSANAELNVIVFQNDHALSMTPMILDSILSMEAEKPLLARLTELEPEDTSF